MRVLAILLNCILFIYVAWIILQDGFDPVGATLLAIVTPAISLIALWKGDSPELLALFIRRKRMEEEQKIRELEDRGASGPNPS